MNDNTLMTEAATTTEGTASQGAPEATAQAAAPGAEQQTTEASDAGGTPAGEASEGEAGKEESTPAKYEFKAPDGVQVDESVMAGFTEVAKELKLAPEAAQSILEKMAPALQARQQEVLQKARDDWSVAAKADKEYGGERLSENLAVAKKAMDAFGSPELRTLLNESGLGNHPELIRVFYRAGKAISEDGFVPGGRASAAPADPAKRLFPNQA